MTSRTVVNASSIDRPGIPQKWRVWVWDFGPWSAQLVCILRLAGKWVGRCQGWGFCCSLEGRGESPTSGWRWCFCSGTIHSEFALGRSELFSSVRYKTQGRFRLSQVSYALLLLIRLWWHRLPLWVFTGALCTSVGRQIVPVARLWIWLEGSPPEVQISGSND